jgi:DNA-binding CsgD family transcriptional regulator
MKPDWVGILESAYQLELRTEVWLKGIVDAVRPWVDDDGLGVAGITYKITPAGRLTVEASSDLSEPLLRGLDGLDPDFVKRSYLRLRVGMSSEVPGWRETQTFHLAKPLGLADALGINGMNPGGRGCLLLSFRATTGHRLPTRHKESLTRIAVHLATAHRLRTRLGVGADPILQAEAILDPDGKVQHAIGPAALRPALRSLGEAVVDVERARGKLRHRDPEGALGSWRGLVAARWTLVEHFEHGGRRYLLARENEPHVPAPAALSPRERQVLAYAAMGHSDKEIAYELGIAHSTVKVLLFRARTKLRVTSRVELLRKFAERSST